LSLLFFVLSLLSKSIAIIFPIILLTFDFCFPVARRRIFLIDKIPFICAAVAIAVVAMYSQLPEVGEGGRVAELHGGSVLGTVFTMLPVFCRYLGMIVWPSSLSAEYHPPVHSSLDGAVLGACLILLTIAGGGWLLYRSDRRLGFWVCFFFVALLPVSQIVPLLTLMNDRYLYFPILSVAALGGSAATVLLRTVDRHPKLVCLFITLPLITLSIVTYKRVGVWRGPVELWSDAATKTPDSSRVWGNLGNAYDASGNRGLAGYAYKRGLEIDPNNEQILFDSGSMYMRLGDNYQAYILLKRLLYLLPNHIMGLVFYGDICLQRGDYAEAEKSYLRAHSLQPDAVDPLVALGNSAVITKRFDDAREYYFKAEKIYEENPDIAYNIACVDSMSGRIDSALLWLDKALHRGFHDETTLRTSQELLLVRGDSRFERLMAHYFTKGLK
jgi:Flp pilus assembly protein TadD